MLPVDSIAAVIIQTIRLHQLRNEHHIHGNMIIN